MAIGFRRNRLVLVRQSAQSECALACIAMIAAHLGRDLPMRQLRLAFPGSDRGTSLRDVMAIAAAVGLMPRPLRLEPGQVRRHRDALMLHWNFDHFVVFQGMRGRRFCILDPADGARAVTAADFGRAFTGVAVSFALSPDAPTLTPPGPRPTLRGIWPAFGGQGAVVTLMVVAAITIQAAQMALPLMTAWIVDTAIPTGDAALIMGTILAMLVVLVLLAACRTVLRGLLLTYSLRVSGLMMPGIVGRLIRLPVAWFHARDRGEILSRVTSAAEVQELALSRGIPAMADALIFVPALVTLAVLDPTIAAIVLTALIAIAVVHLLSARRQRQVEGDRLRTRAAANGTVIELVSQIDSLRIRNAEAPRLAAWQARHQAMLGAERRFEQGERLSDMAIDIVLALTSCAILATGALAVVAGTLTVGVLLAILMIVGLMTAAVARMAIFLRNFHALASHLENIASLQDQATDADAYDSPVPRLWARPARDLTLQMEDVRYRHPGAATDVLQGITLQVAPGEMVGIVGGSGAGKSTLVGLATGLIQPTAGRITVDGRTLHPGRCRDYRARIGVVLQGDGVFRGTIADNICGFSDFPDRDAMDQAARLAVIDDDIAALPLGFNTPIGDGGATLSGGQVQRIMIARALYGQPSLLILDEGTANLDLDLEERIHNNLARLGLARLVVTHRPQVLSAWATRVLTVAGGTVRADPARAAAE